MINEGKEIDIAKADIVFIWKNIKTILPYHLFACVIAFLFALARALAGDKGIEILIDKIPSLFLLQAFQFPGSSEAFLGAEWYISTMLVVMFILYPFMLKFKNIFAGISAPIICLSLLSYNATVNAALIGTNRNIRGMQDICLGVGCYYAFTMLKDKKIGIGWKRALCIIEILCYALVLVYCFSTSYEKYQIYTALLLCVAVTITFFGKGMSIGCFNNKVCYLLEKLSIPVYLMQNPIISGILFIKEKSLLSVLDSLLAAIDFALIVIVGNVAYFACEYIKKKNMKQRLVDEKN